MRVNLLSAVGAERLGGQLALQLSSRAGVVEQSFEIPAPGFPIALQIDAASGEMLSTEGNSDLAFGHTQWADSDLEVNAVLQIGGSTIEFGYSGLSSEDTFSLIQLDPDYYLATVRHFQLRTQCRARCHDGTEGQPCVDCTADGILVRICC